MGAQSILITDDAAFGKAVEQAVERQLTTLSRAETARASWRDFGAIILVPDLAAAIPLANRIAAEHLELAVDDPDALMKDVRNAGAIFVGRHTPEVIGDYVGGSNHVLPTARSARFSSGLSVLGLRQAHFHPAAGAGAIEGAGAGCYRTGEIRRARCPWPVGRDPPEP